MNPTTDEQLPPPPQPPQPHRNSTSCDRHPDEQFTGFCPSCLCERLAVLDKTASASASASSGRKSASSAIKSLFIKPSNNDSGPSLRGRPSSSSFLPELRRTKSFSGGKNEGFLGFSGVFEPQRKSCDVRGRSTLFSLFSQDDEKKRCGSGSGSHPHRPTVALNNDAHLGDSTSRAVIQSKEGQPDHEEEAKVGVVVEEEEEFHDSNDNGDEIQVLEEEIVAATSNNYNLKNPLLSSSGEQIGEIVEEREEEEVDLKTMKDHIDLDSHNKKAGSTSTTKDFKELAGSFWSAASVFSKKLRAWTKKHNNNQHHKVKKHNGSHTVQVSGIKKGNGYGRNYRDTQSEIADYGYGRRSCDTDPRLSFDVGRFSVDAGRFSVDAGRISFDDPRYSFDEPRASWDGYLIGRPNFPRMAPPPPMVSVVEDAPVVVQRYDTQIPVEEPRRSSVSINGEDCCVPGGAAQTKDYYSDSSSRRRKSLDRSNSIRKTAAAVVAEMDELKNQNNTTINNNSNTKISPASLVGERDLNSNSTSLRDDCSESFDLGFRDNNGSVIGNGERKGSKKSRRWRAWNIWSLIYRRGNAKDEDEDLSSSRANGVERSLSESWQELRRDGYGVGDPRLGFNRNVFRSNSSVSWRNSSNFGGSLGSIRKNSNSIEPNGRKKKDEFVLERNRSARYSPTPSHHADNGMLRFYLTPMKGSRRGGSGKPKPAYSQSFARSVLRLY